MDNWVVSYSELDTYRQCPLKHVWAYKERWRKPPTTDGALAKGSLWHLVMEDHYNVLKEGGTLNEARDKVFPYFVNEQSGVTTDTQDLIRWMYEGYVEQYGADDEWEIIDVEMPFQINLPDPNGEPSRYDLKGKIDIVVKSRQNGLVWAVDHKSGANLPDQMDLDIDDQFGLYVWALKQLGMNPAGAVHSASRTTRNQADRPDYTGKSKPQTLDQRYRRTYLNRSDTELTSLALDAWAVASNAYPTSEFKPPIYSSPDPRQCGWKCDFKEVHLLARKGKNPEQALTEYGFVQDFTRH